jgi:hypothetical protein
MTTGGLFTSLQAYVLDTRHGVGGYPVAAFTAGHWYSVGIDGQGGVPTSNVAAVQVTFTVPDATAAGVLHADQDGISSPNTSLPYVTYGTTQISNTAVIPVGADGNIQVELTSTADLIVNVQGYFTGGNAAGGGYVPLNATQVYNSGTTQYGPGQTVTFPVAGLGGVPSNASSVMFDIIEANGGSPSGWLTAYPGGATRPTSSLNWPAGSNYEWSTAVPMNSTGNITIYIGGGSGTVSLSVGVEGYFTASDGTTSAGEFTAATGRVFDSTATQPIASGTSITIPVAGVAGLPDLGSGIAAVAANIEISPGSGAQGHIQVFADDASSPGQSAQQFYSGKTTFAFDVVSLGGDGGITIQNSSTGSINVTVDAEGWYQAIAQPTISCPADYPDGSWTVALPAAPITCSVVAPADPSSTSGVLHLSVDDNPIGDYTLSHSAPTVESVTIPNTGGQHAIGASTDADGRGLTNENDYAVGLGDWASAALTPSIPDGSNASTVPTLSVTSAQGAFDDGVQMNYTVSTSPDGTGVVATSGWTSDPYTLPQALTDQTEYYWSVEVQGTSGGTSTIQDVSSPEWSFLADATLYQAPVPDGPADSPDFFSDNSCQYKTTYGAVKHLGNITKVMTGAGWSITGTSPKTGPKVSLSVSSSKMVGNEHTYSASIGGGPSWGAISGQVGYNVEHEQTMTVTVQTDPIPNGQTWEARADKIYSEQKVTYKETETCHGPFNQVTYTGVVKSGTATTKQFLHLHGEDFRVAGPNS